MNSHGGSSGAILNGNPADKIPPNLCYPLESQATIEHQRLQHQQRQTNYNNFGEFRPRFAPDDGKGIKFLSPQRETAFNEWARRNSMIARMIVLIIWGDYYTL